jgi:hypothetical protein
MIASHRLSDVRLILEDGGLKAIVSRVIRDSQVSRGVGTRSIARLCG